MFNVPQCVVLGMDALANADICMNPESPGGQEIDLKYLMIKTSDYIGTVSKAMRRRMLEETVPFEIGGPEGGVGGRSNAQNAYWFLIQLRESDVDKLTVFDADHLIESHIECCLKGISIWLA